MIHKPGDLVKFKLHRIEIRRRNRDQLAMSEPMAFYDNLNGYFELELGTAAFVVRVDDPGKDLMTVLCNGKLLKEFHYDWWKKA